MSWRHLLAAALAALTLASAVAVVWTKQMARNAFVELQSLKADRDQLNMEWGQLQLEQSTWAAHGRIEELARETLNMRLPVPDQVVLIRR